MYFDPNPQKLYADLRRSGRSGVLIGVPLGHDALMAVLEFDGGALDLLNRGLGRVADMLPLGTLSGPQKAAYMALINAGGGHVEVLQIIDGLRMCDFMVTPAITPDALTGLMGREDAYAGYTLLGQRMKDNGMTLRLVNGAFLWFQNDKIMAYLEEVIADPNA